MCGLVGIIGEDLDQADSNVFRWMLMLDTIRGEHSTGVSVRCLDKSKENNATTFIHAKAMGFPPYLFMRYPEVFQHDGKMTDGLFKRNTVTYMMGHNRQQTIGAVSLANAHPFRNTRFIGCHNGTIQTTGMSTLNPYAAHIKGDTDSEMIYAKLADKEGDLNATLKGLCGAAALSYWDKVKKTFNLYRNEERTLFMCRSNTGKKVLYASEEFIIERALNKAKRRAMFGKIDPVPAHTLHSFTIQTNGVVKVETQKTTVLRKNIICSGELPVTHTPSNNNVSRLNYGNNGYRYGGSKTAKAPLIAGRAQYTPTLPVQKNSNSNKMSDQDYFEIFYGSGLPFSNAGWFDPDKLTREEIIKTLEGGCQLCQTSLFFLDHVNGDVKWMDRDTPLCTGCADDWH